MAKVVIENLVKIYPDKSGAGVRAVNGVNLTVEDREFMVLVGPSGCGKSTTLRMIAGLEEISSGEIRIGERRINEVPPKDRDIAMVFQNYALYPHMSVYENMAFGLRLRKFSSRDIDGRVKEAAGILGIADLLGRRPKELSGGQRQRVAVGRAIVRKPKVFLFDEPLSNLDAKMRVTMRAEISRLHARLDSTMIYVTHDQVEAMTMGDRICVMRDGDIMQVAAPLELYRNPANLFVAGFIGSPPMNLLRGCLQEAGGGGVLFVEDNGSRAPMVVPLGEQLARVGRAFLGRRVVLGVRPEDMELAEGEAAGVRLAWPVRVDVVEPMGHETHLYLDTGAHALIARVRGGEEVAAGAELRVRFSPDRALLFDAESERQLQ